MTGSGKQGKSWLAAIALVAVAAGAHAETFRPADDALVLLRVPDATVRTRPPLQTVAAALERAAQHIDEGRRTGQPRGFGQAEAVLETWRSRAQSSTQWHVLGADIRQYRHQYGEALALLQRALQLEPANARALLMRAAILQTQGRFEAARGDCAALLSNGEAALDTVCMAQVLGLTGQLERAHGLLERQLRHGKAPPGAVQVWMLGGLADMAERLGRTDEAYRLLREALRVQPRDPFSSLALVDLMLAQEETAVARQGPAAARQGTAPARQGTAAAPERNEAAARRRAEIEGLLLELPRTSAVLLRLAEVRRQQGEDIGARLVQLRQMMGQARERGEQSDLRELVRLQRLEGRPCDALQTARANWKVQREPADVRLLLGAARECYDPRARGEVARWRSATRYEDARVDVWLGKQGRS